MYSFAHKEEVELKVNSKTKDETFGFKLASNNLTGRTYVEEIVDSVSSTTVKAFNNKINSSCLKLRGTYITHINYVPVFSTAQV